MDVLLPVILWSTTKGAFSLVPVLLSLALVSRLHQPAASHLEIFLSPFNLFQSYTLEFGDFYMRVLANGAYVTDTPLSINAATRGNPCNITVPGIGSLTNPWQSGQLIFISNVSGMTQLNGQFYLLGSVNLSSGVCSLQDIFGDPINSLGFTAYSFGGTAARIYSLATPYAAVDLPYLKFRQSADVMSLTCVNQETQVEYEPQELTRLSSNNWTIAPPVFASSIAAPASCTATPSKVYVSTPPGPAAYGYVVTAVDAITGDESVASPIGVAMNSVDIAGQFGTVTVTWAAVNGAGSYNVYRATPDYTNTGDFVGQLFGYVGTSFSLSWQDTNLIPDQAITPPLHLNPFVGGQIIGAKATAGGTGYTFSTIGYTINTTTGSGAVLGLVVSGGALVAIIIQSPGQKYAATDTITITDSGSGASATASLTIGPQTGVYPGVVSYFQQRRAYAGSLNAPDTYEMSQPGSYTNFDSANPPIDSDSITGTPWATQVNGVQWMEPMPGGLIAATGASAWQISGTGGSGSPITPSQQSAQPQDQIGFSSTVPIIRINYALLYVPPAGTQLRELQYNFYFNIYGSADRSILSSHLFNNRTIKQWAWSLEPWKMIWIVASDGKLISFAYLPEEEVRALTRHDTNGLFQSVSVASEPPADAPYFIVKRYIKGKGKWIYCQERMDNRLWNSVEQAWCVDCGLALAQPDSKRNFKCFCRAGKCKRFGRLHHQWWSKLHRAGRFH